MTDDRSSELLGQLPRTRPHRRSAKRPTRPAEQPRTDVPETPPAEVSSVRTPSKRSSRAPARPTQRPRAKPRTAKGSTSSRAKPLAQPAQPRGIPKARRPQRPSPAVERPSREIPKPVLGTAVQAAGELAEIGLAFGARALRRAIGRFPRP